MELLVGEESVYRRILSEAVELGRLSEHEPKGLLHKEQQLDVKGVNGSEFRLILRQAEINPFDFSIILGYRVPRSNEIYRLRRYNGKHGEHTNVIERQTFYDYHVHMATARYREAGLKEDAYAEPTDRFSDFRGALDCMLRECGFDVPEEPQTDLMEIMGVQ